jgi:hypothetical protein
VSINDHRRKPTKKDEKIQKPPMVGICQPASRNPNEYGLFRWNSRHASDLASSDAFVGFRPFASVFGLCQRDVTRNVTR